MKNILYVISTLKRTGPTNILYNLIAKLDRSCFSPIILTLSIEDKRFPSLTNEFLDLGIAIHSLRLSRIKGFIEGRSALKEFIKNHNINIVHINGFRADLLIKAKDYPGLRIITTINSNIYDDYTMLYGKVKGSLMAWIHAQTIKDKVSVGCSNFVSDELYKRYGITLKVIYNGIPKEMYNVSGPMEKEELRTKLGLPPNKRIFIFVGYLIFRKDPVSVIDAFLSSTICNDSFLILVGDGPLMLECKQLSSSSPNVLLVGNQPQTLSYLNASDFYISSAHSEGLPTSVMEAMGCGLPVILSRIAPHEELVRKLDGWPYMFPVCGVSDLKEKLEKIVDEPYQALSEKCRLIIENYINSDQMALDYQELYIR
jgi:glycosyltransferase involved in cell wall biosynthesis